MSELKLPIYLDYSSTTPVDPRVAAKMAECLTLEGNFGNPASRSHRFGWQAEELVDIARNQIADLVNADPREIVLTSGATESDNLAIKGAAHFYSKKGKHIITVKTEHKAVLDTCRQLEREGFEVTYMDPEPNGLIGLETSLKRPFALTPFLPASCTLITRLVLSRTSLRSAKSAVKTKSLFHVDAAQSAGKVEIDLQALKVDLMSFSAHKIYGPKGIGALVCTP